MNSDLVAHFTALVNAHDLTYTYSDDDSVFRRGDAQYKAIKSMVPSVGEEVAKQIWNANVEKKMQPFVWDEFKWN